jgi:hypothetical protein
MLWIRWAFIAANVVCSLLGLYWTSRNSLSTLGKIAGAAIWDLASSRSRSRCFLKSHRMASRLVVHSRIPARHAGCPNHDSDGLLHEMKAGGADTFRLQVT